MPEFDAEEPESTPPASTAKRRRPLRRFGCFLVLVLWCIILLSPCFLVVLATQQEILIQTGELPGQSLRIWLVNEPRQRGIGISRPSIYAEAENIICLQVDVNFLLWMGSEKPNTYCDCFSDPGNKNWELVSSNPEICNSK